MSAVRLVIIAITSTSLLAGLTPVTANDQITSELITVPDFEPNDSLNQPSDSKQSLSWQLGEPDLIVKLPETYKLSPANSDVFRNFVIRNVVASDRYVRALEFRIDNSKAIHHAEFLLDESDASWIQDLEEPVPGFSGMNISKAHHPDGYFVNWVPGKNVSELAKDLAWRLPAKADLVVQLHMMPSRSEEVIDPQIGLYFADEPPEQNPQMIWLGSRWLPISAGDTDFKARDSYVLPVAADVLSALPHCHLICKNIKAWATLPDGSQLQLLTIDSWNFYEQEEVNFEKPITLPQRTTVSVEFNYDNSVGNRFNPNNPPLEMEFGPLSSNEMADFWIQVVPRNQEDGMRLRNSTARHLDTKLIERQAKLLELNSNVSDLLELALLYQNTNQQSKAVTQLQIALQLEPENLIVLERLAIALTNAGRPRDALAHWRQLVQIDPNDPQSRMNLATALGFLNEVEEAELHLKRAAELNPSSGPIFYRLGRAQSYLGRFDDALVSFNSALDLNPNQPAVLQSAANLLASHPIPSKRRPDEALALVNRALEQMAEPDPVILSTLATAQAATGDFERAVLTAKLALSTAETSNGNFLVPTIRRQIEFYEQGRIQIARAAGDKRFNAPGER